MLETGFGLGNNFLATWDAWRQDPARSQRLVFVSVDQHPWRASDLAAAHATGPLAALAPDASARELLDDWDNALKSFIKVMPKDYKRALLQAREQAAAKAVAAE